MTKMLTPSEAVNDDALPDQTANALILVAKGILRQLEERNSFFDAELFAEPVWKILLDLYIHNASGKAVSVSSVCIASGVPPTTALRWLNLLAERELIFKFGDDADRRRVLVRLTPHAFKDMTAYLTQSKLVQTRILAGKDHRPQLHELRS